MSENNRQQVPEEILAGWWWRRLIGQGGRELSHELTTPFFPL